MNKIYTDVAITTEASAYSPYPLTQTILIVSIAAPLGAVILVLITVIIVVVLKKR